MEYEVFERDFIIRTLKIISQYEQYVLPKPEEHYEVTLLINCLLGLLVLPNELCLEDIPDVPIKQLYGWGLKEEYIQNCRPARPKDGLTLKDVILHMRNSVAHGQFKSSGQEKEIKQLEFSANQGRSKIIIPVDSLKIFVTKLAESMKEKP